MSVITKINNIQYCNRKIKTALIYFIFYFFFVIGFLFLYFSLLLIIIFSGFCFCYDSIFSRSPIYIFSYNETKKHLSKWMILAPALPFCHIIIEWNYVTHVGDFCIEKCQSLPTIFSHYNKMIFKVMMGFANKIGISL